MEVLDRVVEAAIADKKLAELASERAKRIEARADRARDIALKIVEALRGESARTARLYSAH